jgi:hypothetical protein
LLGISNLSHALRSTAASKAVALSTGPTTLILSTLFPPEEENIQVAIHRIVTNTQGKGQHPEQQYR